MSPVRDSSERPVLIRALPLAIALVSALTAQSLPNGGQLFAKPQDLATPEVMAVPYEPIISPAP